MPTYEYECLTNRHRFEVKQSFTDPSLTACEVCGEPVRKVFSAAGIVFKGSGYYVNDTRAPESSGKGASSGDGAGTKGTGDKGSAETSTGDKSSSPAKAGGDKAGSGTAKPAKSSTPASSAAKD